MKYGIDSFRREISREMCTNLRRPVVQVYCILMYCVSRMAVDGGHRDGGCNWDGRWNHVRKFLERPGPFTHPDFEPSTEVGTINLQLYAVQL